MIATIITLIPVADVIPMLMVGKCSHIVRSLFGFVSASHSLQLFDPISLLIVPCGHVIQSQQHGVLGAFIVPGRHSDAQKATGPDKLFTKGLQRKLVVFILSLGLASLSQTPTRTFL